MLIDRGYDTIISVSVKGPGVVKNIDRCGINIIEINAHSPEIGIMDFDTDAIAESKISALDLAANYKEIANKIKCFLSHQNIFKMF